jgi:hypothetical protein
VFSHTFNTYEQPWNNLVSKENLLYFWGDGANNAPNTETLLTADAYGIDKKIDDGMPNKLNNLAQACMMVFFID